MIITTFRNSCCCQMWAYKTMLFLRPFQSFLYLTSDPEKINAVKLYKIIFKNTHTRQESSMIHLASLIARQITLFCFICFWKYADEQTGWDIVITNCRHFCLMDLKHSGSLWSLREVQNYWVLRNDITYHVYSWKFLYGVFSGVFCGVLFLRYLLQNK